MNEIALILGPEQNLIGVLTPPIGTAKLTTVLLLNAGVVHRIGPHRTSVKLARHLAAMGHPVVRFDIAGVGDSRPPRHAASFTEQAASDIKAVMDQLQRDHGLRSFALFGICAGAANAFATAVADARVAGIFLFDGYSYPTLKGEAIRLIARARRGSFGGALKAFRRLAANVASTLRRPDADAAKTYRADKDWAPPKAKYACDLQALVDRGVSVALLFSGSFYPWYTYAMQFQDGFHGHRFVDEVSCHLIPEIDHLVTSLEAQRQLIALVGHWASARLK